MCKCVLPPGDNPVAVNKHIIYQKLKFHLNLTKITGTLHDKHMYICDISLNSSYNEKCFRQRCRENQSIRSIFNIFFFFFFLPFMR
jgi:hypothetical protein